MRKGWTLSFIKSIFTVNKMQFRVIKNKFVSFFYLHQQLMIFYLRPTHLICFFTVPESILSDSLFRQIFPLTPTYMYHVLICETSKTNFKIYDLIQSEIKFTTFAIRNENAIQKTTNNGILTVIIQNKNPSKVF